MKKSVKDNAFDILHITVHVRHKCHTNCNNLVDAYVDLHYNDSICE